MTAKIVGTGGRAVTTAAPIQAFVDITMDGNPFIAWLLYRGELYSPNVIDRGAVGFAFGWYQFFRGTPGSQWRIPRYALEKELEDFRKSNFPNAISRLDGFFLFPSEELARQAERNSTFRVKNLLEVEIAPGARVSCYDMDWVSYHVMNRSEGNFWFPDYFKGEGRTATPASEYVVEGRARIISEVDLNKAVGIVNSHWPGYRQLLVASREACKRGEDGGVILPRLSPDGLQLYFDIKEVEPKDSALGADWNNLRSLVSTRYRFPVC